MSAGRETDVAYGLAHPGETDVVVARLALGIAQLVEEEKHR